MSSDLPGPAETIARQIADLLRERYGPPVLGRRDLPDGLRVEMHPGVSRLITRDLDTARWPWDPGTNVAEMLEGRFEVPVIITARMPPGTWRLVIVAETELIAGLVT